ncbi:DUF1244 domain-containing protein [Marinicella litoralis]|uniref:SMc04008-like domain-containing protein n=1 Tax=Marinicella litoralis TaxID=644220 RepID=A0A4R6XBZ2_9GAMM|nr:DUF1244 domain-containing protein [Marinicella litoralis]TDR16762.1 hypothetical protein C8D91_2668 [Marinicella litoralis]
MEKETEIKARVLDRLIEHFDQHKEVQNIDLMILANFCRNCLSKWTVQEGQEIGVDIDIDEARKMIYKMDYAEWKAKHQPEATPEQLAQFNKLKQ